MAHTHGDAGQGHHSHGGSGDLTWQVLDAFVACAATVFVLLLIDLVVRARREGVRFDLTDKGRAATERAPAEPEQPAGD
jgi:hypothetical protein